MNYYEANTRIEKLKKIIKDSEDEIARLAVEYEIDVSIGEYGSGRHVVLNEDYEYDGYEVGQWIPSSATC